MKHKSLTTDERYLVRLFEMALKFEGVYSEVDRYAIGQNLSINDKSVDNIVRMLAQTNFIKKGEGSAIYLTPHGEQFVNSLKKQLQG